MAQVYGFAVYRQVDDFGYREDEGDMQAHVGQATPWKHCHLLTLIRAEPGYLGSAYFNGNPGLTGEVTTKAGVESVNERQHLVSHFVPKR